MSQEFRPLKIGKYLLLERLAMGGMAEVYRAKASGASGFEKQLAIKRILPNYSQNEEFRRMFEYEARLSSMLTHANIVQVYDFVKSGDTYLLALEYVDGKNLRQFLNKIKKLNYILPLEAGLYIISEVCKGLEYAHLKKDDITGRPLNIIHRDMSPQNVMLSYDGAVKIVDFGIAKAKDRVNETRSGVIKGKFGYMSPEQANGEVIDHRSDLFSTSIILYEMCTNRRLFISENDLATLKMIQECIIPPPQKFNPKIKADLEKILLKGLSKDTSLRYQTAGELQRAIQNYCNKNSILYGSKELADLMQKVFSEDIIQEKKRIEQLHKQSIPFSVQSAPVEEDTFSGIPEFEGENATELKTKNSLDLSNEQTLITSSGEIEVRKENQKKQKEKEVVETEPNSSKATPDKYYGLDFLPLGDSTVPNTSQKVEVDDNQSKIATEAATSVKKKNEEFITDPAEVFQKEKTAITKIKDETAVTGRSNSGKSEKSIINIDLDDLEGEPAESSITYKVKKAKLKPIKEKSVSFTFFGQAILLTGLGFGVYEVYRRVSTGQTKVLIQKMINQDRRAITNDPAAEEGKEARQKKEAKGSCLVNIESDPSGAKVFINEKLQGITPYNSLVPCNKDLKLKLYKDGFEIIKERLYTAESKMKLFKVMKSVPVGYLTVFATQNLTIEIPELGVNEPIKSLEETTFSIPAGNSLKINFKNETLGLYKTETIYLQPNQNLKKKITY